MTRRIIGQCSTSDFRYLEHLADIMRRGEEVDTSNLTNTQKMAVLVLKRFQERDVKFSVLLKIREVLVWELDGGGYAFEYKLIDPRDVNTGNILRGMRRT